MKEINKKREETSGWRGALSAIRGEAWLTSTQMQSSTTNHTTYIKEDGTKIQCAQEQQIKAWTDKNTS